MVIKGLDPVAISKLTSQQVEHVTCIECCKYYIAPETAACGHTLCHTCWKGRRVCHTCAASIDRKTLKLNLPLQTLTEHVHVLADAFEKLFNVKLDEFTLDVLDDLQSEDPTKHVKEWLANSENHFSVPVASSQLSELELPKHMELPKSKIQIHTDKNKSKSPDKVVKPPQPQEDWDKIEVLPDTEEVHETLKDYVISPKDLEPVFFDENEYTNNNLRRSSRKRELKADSNPPTYDISADKNSMKNSSVDTKSLKNKQTWNSVKKMRKEFSKLNKKNRSKLNVSIEMCKKTQNAANRPKQAQTLPQNDSEQFHYIIDDNTPHVSNNNNPRRNSKKDNSKNIESALNASNNVNNICTEKDLPEVFDKRNSISQNKESSKMDKDIPENILNLDKIENNNDKHELSLDNNVPVCSNNMPFIKKSALLPKSTSAEEKDVQITQKKVITDTSKTSTDDIEISIKIGNTVTNIIIKDKRNNVHMKVNTDQGVQTSLGPYGLVNKNDAACSPMTDVNVQTIELNIVENNKIAVNKTISSKKNTASADTAPASATAQFEITDSIDKELSDVMEHLERKRNRTGFSQKTSHSTKSSQAQIIKNQSALVMNNAEDKINNELTPQSEKSAADQNKGIEEVENVNRIPEDMEDLNDIDIFNSGSIKEANVKLLKDSHMVASEILMPTIKSKKSQKIADKRQRGRNDDIDLPCTKKQRIDLDIINENEKEIPCISPEKQTYEAGNNSEPMNYDAIMSQVFANIDAEIHNTNSKHICKTQNHKQKVNESQIARKDTQLQSSQIIHKTQNKLPHRSISSADSKNNSSLKEENQKYSENVFSMLEKESQSHDVVGKNNNKVPATTTQQRIDNLLTPGMCRDLAATRDSNTQMDKGADMVELIHGTPVVDNDDSESVVEETPQKNMSFSKPKQNNITNAAENQKQQKPKQSALDVKTTDSQIIRSIIDISDTSTMESSKMKDPTVVEVPMNKISVSMKDQVLETPLTINKFVNHIKHNSTPVARKSLNFDSEQDPEQTICPTTTQEKEFLSEAFKHTPISPIKRALTLKNIFNSPKKFCVAGSCLSPAQSKNLKILCHERNWTYLDKYTKDLTHLVVGVDEENKSQRSVKYMCALAASKWIVTYSWVEKCLQSKTVVDELPYEALDACGEPGPRRSRTAIKKVFDGITIYCMPPFSLLEIDTLKQMLDAAGAHVVDNTQAVKITQENSTRPALLLAEPEHTQEDRFVFFAMEHKIVPVNFEWALNCLGTYSLCSIHDLLLCPFSILPSYISDWPDALLKQEDDEEE